MLLVTRSGKAYSAQFVSGTYIYHFMGTRSPEASERLASAIGGSVPYQAVRSLRITEDPDESAWLIGDGWWLSTREA